MYKNIGDKIKTLAVFDFAFFTFVCVVTGIAAIVAYHSLLSILIMTIGPLVAWIASFTLYGFGQLVENSDKLVAINNKLLKNSNKSAQ